MNGCLVRELVRNSSLVCIGPEKMLACCAMLEAEGAAGSEVAAGCSKPSVLRAASRPASPSFQIRYTGNCVTPRCLEYIYRLQYTSIYISSVRMLVPRLKPGKRPVPGCNVNGSGSPNLLILSHYMFGSRTNAFLTQVCERPL